MAAFVHQLSDPHMMIVLSALRQEGALEVADLGGGRIAGLVRYRCVEPPAEARVRCATKLLKRVALSELLPAGKRAKADAIDAPPPPPSEADGSTGASKPQNANFLSAQSRTEAVAASACIPGPDRP